MMSNKVESVDNTTDNVANTKLPSELAQNAQTTTSKDNYTIGIDFAYPDSTDIDSMVEIPGYEGLYAITKDGRVWSYKKLNSYVTWMKSREDKYKRIELRKDNKKKSHYLHRLLAEAYIPNPDNLPYVNHIDGNKHNNNLGNLEWCTHAENMKHAFTIGLKNLTGSKNNNSKLVEEDAIDIRMLFEKGFDRGYLANVYKVNRATINHVIARDTWKHV